MSEYNQTTATVEWWGWQYPAYINCLIGIPNGANLAGTPLQRAKQMIRLKKEGLKPGASDLFLALPRGGYHGLWIEMKDTGKGEKDVSVDQMRHIELMRTVGYKAEWCAGTDNAQAVISTYMTL
jgi:hypothetical protein